ncbi:MAG: DUF4234 domain-containing protein [Leptospiraceae bacterium]|nr:DUF4234 domain-containing protein [Leptospiraceae bacterium]MCP5497401.1 DUF4234 domain-containing protein [Leptospiraceae bacterium]
MENRNPIVVFLLTCITCGIYAIVWCVKTKEEMNAKGAEIPTAWLLILPFINFYWYWKYSEGVEKVTKSEVSAAIVFVLLLLLGPIGMAVVQNYFNKVS